MPIEHKYAIVIFSNTQLGVWSAGNYLFTALNSLINLRSNYEVNLFLN